MDFDALIDWHRLSEIRIIEAAQSNKLNLYLGFVSGRLTNGGRWTTNLEKKKKYTTRMRDSTIPKVPIYSLTSNKNRKMYQ
jgi:hypothetical protein